MKTVAVKQEHRIAGALSKDKNILSIYQLEKEYDTGIRVKPVDPNGNSYNDPGCDVHIQASKPLHPEVKRILLEEPWNANKENSSLIAEYRQKGKILNYSSIYLASPQSLAGQLDSTVEEATKTLEDFFSYPDGFYGLAAWLKAIGTIAEQRRWVETALGGKLFCHETNAKGLDSASRRKGVNGCVQGLAAEQIKLSIIKAQKEIDRLNFKYRPVLNGREGRITSVVHDEINSIVPGDIEMVPEIDSKTGCRIYIPKLDLSIGEHALAFEYGEAVRQSMEAAMKYTFEKFCDSDLPAKSSMSLSRMWLH